MPITGFNHYNLRAPRPLLEELREFYADVLGLKAGYRPPFKSFGYWIYVGDRDILHLTETAPGENRSTDAVTTFDHIAFTCSNPAAFKQLLDRAGVRYTEDQVPDTGQTQLFFTDPAGNGIELNFARQ